MKTYQHIQFFIFTLIGFSLCVQVGADEPINLEYKLKAGNQIREDVTLTCVIEPAKTSEGLTFTVRYPTTTFVSESQNKEAATLYTIYQPELIETPARGEASFHSEDRSVREQLQREVRGFFLQKYQLDLSGRLIEPPRSETLADNMVALRTPFDFIGALPTEPIKIGDGWTQKIDHPQIGQLTVNLKLTAIETINGYEHAKLEGTVSGKMSGPDKAEMTIVDGKYIADFNIREGVMIDEKITVKLEAKLPKQVTTPPREAEQTSQPDEGKQVSRPKEAAAELYSLHISYSTKLVDRKTLTGTQLDATVKALKLIETGKNALYDGNHKVAKGAFDQFLADYPDSLWKSGVETLLAKTASLSHQKTPVVVAEPEREFSPMARMRFGGSIGEWLVCGPMQIPEELMPTEVRRSPGRRSPTRSEEEQGESPLEPLVEHDFLENIGGEANVRPSPGDQFEINGEMLTWKHQNLTRTKGTLDQLPGFDVERGIAYLATYFKSAKSGTFNMELGRGDNNTLAIWVNGERVWNKSEQRELERQDFRDDSLNVTPVNIKKGWNAVLLKTAKIGRGGRAFRSGRVQSSPPRRQRGRGREGWRFFTRWHGLEIIDSKTAWNSHGEINTVDGFNVVLADEKAEFVLTADVIGAKKTVSIMGIDILLPVPLRNSDAKVVGDVQIGSKKISTSSAFADGLLKIRWEEKMSSDDTMSVKFDAKVAPNPANMELDFGVKLVSANGSVVQELEGRNTEVLATSATENWGNSNGFSEIKILVDKSDVFAPTDVKVEPVFGENDVIVRWAPSEDTRVNGYDILADGRAVGHIHGVDRTEWTHHNLTPESTIAYTVKAIVIPQLTSPASKATTAQVGTDTTEPSPPMEVREAIPLGEESGGSRAALSRQRRYLDMAKLGKLISWKPSLSADVVNYEILRGEPNSDMVKIATVPADTTEYLDVDAPESEWYQVRAVDDVGNSAIAELELASGRRELYFRGREYRQRREMGKYLAMMRRAIQHESESGNQWNEWNVDELQQELVTAFAEQKALELLTPIYEAAIKSEPENIQNYNLLAKIYLADEKTDKAVETLEKTIPLAAKAKMFRMVPYYNLTQAYAEQGNAEKAIATMKELMENDRSNELKFWLSPDLAELYAKFEMFDEVRALAGEMEKTFENPEAAGIPKQYLLRQIARIYAAGKSYDEAIRWSKELLFNGRIEPWMRDEIAELYDKAGESEVANLIRGGRGRRGGRDGQGGELRRMKHGLPQAPALPMRTLSEERVRLSDYPDKLIFVNFFDISENSLTMLRTLEETYQDNKNLVVLGIAMDRVERVAYPLDAEKVQSAIEEAGVTYPIAIGTRAVHDLFEFAIGELTDELPTTFAIIGNESLLHEKREGILSKEELQDLIASMKQHRKDLNLEPNILWANRVIEFSSEYSDSDWSAEQILGQPDTYPQNGDLPTAWASESEDGQSEFVKVGYEVPAHITGVKIYETYNPGAVNRVEAIDGEGDVHLLWQGAAETLPQKKRIFRIDVPATEYKVQAILIHFDSQQVKGWNQIDAVGIVYQE